MPISRNKQRLASVLLQFSLDPSRWGELVDEIQPHPPSAVDQDSELADQLAEAELLSWQMRGQPSPADTAYSWLIVDRAGVLRMRHDACHATPGGWSQLLQDGQVGTQLRWHSHSHESAARQAMIDAGKQNGGHTLLTLSRANGSQTSTHAIVTGAAYAPASLQPLVPAGGFVVTLPVGSLTQSCRFMLSDGFGVTTAEMALIERLSAGDDLNAAASGLAITTNTARNQLKSVFRKTGVRRQADLLLLIAHSATLGTPVVKGVGSAPPRRFLTCEDGRRIAYRIYGEGGAQQALGFHEGLGSSLMPPGTDALARENDLAFIVADRPGFGLTDPLPEYSYEGVLTDSQMLLDALNITSVSLFGVLSGGAHAMKAASGLRQEITGLVLCSARPPGPALEGDNRASMHLRQVLLRHRWLTVPFFSILRNAWSVNLVNRLRNGAQVPASDRAFFDAHPESLQYLFDYGSEAMLRSTQGVIEDLRCLATPMDLDAAQIDMPVVVWHGEQDALVHPEELLRYLEAPPWHSPQHIHIVPGAGTSLSLQIQGEIMATLAG